MIKLTNVDIIMDAQDKGRGVALCETELKKNEVDSFVIDGRFYVITIISQVKNRIAFEVNRVIYLN